MAKREAGDTAVLDRPVAEGEGAKAVFPMGRGKLGKSAWARWAADRAMNQGREVTVADADRTNQTLSAFFPNVVSPPSAGDEDMGPWLDALLEQHITERKSLIVDFGGGDLLLKGAALELGLAGFLAEQGLHPVALHFIGADKDDIAYLQSMEEGGLFTPERTAIIFNVGVLPAGVSEQAAFAKHTANPALRAAVDRGAKLIRMPRLGCMHKIDDARLRFTNVTAQKIGLMDAQRVAIWLRDMEEAFEPILEWLP